MKDADAPPVAVEVWADAALREIEKRMHVPHYLQTHYKNAHEAAGVAIERLARTCTGSVRLFCSTKTIVGRAAVEVLTPLAKTVVYPVG